MKSLYFLLVFLLLSFSGASYSKDDTAQISQILQTVLFKHETSQNYHEWFDSKQSPINTFIDLSNKITEEKEVIDLCQSLSQLKIDDLSLFYRALTETNLGKSLPCHSQLVSKVTDFWNLTQSNLRMRPFEQDYPYFQSFLMSTNNTIGPSEEKEISTTGGPIFITGDLAPGEIAFTFDDGPHSKLTEKLLEILNAEDLQVTFFMVGQNVKNYPLIANSVLEENHSIGNHSWSHKYLPGLTNDDAQAEIDRGLKAIHDILGFITPFFRFPYGAKTNYTKTYLKQNDTSAFYWNMDTLDWKIKNPEDLFDYAIEQIETAGGGIVLFHDVQPQTIVMMPAFLRELKARKFKPVVFRIGDK